MKEGDNNHSSSSVNDGGNEPKGVSLKQGWQVRVKNWLINHKKQAPMAIAGAIIVVLGLVWVLGSTGENDKNQPLTGAAASYAKQLPELSNSVKDNPTDPNARKNYAVALYATKNLKEAKEQYEKAAELNSKDATTYNNLGNVYRDLGEIDKAVNAYRKSIELAPTSINPYVNLANVQLYSQNKPDDAIATYKQALVSLPDNEQIELLLGLAYEQKGDVSTAKKTYQSILSRNPNNAAAKANLERLNAG